QQKNVIPEGYAFPAGQKSASILADTVDENYFEILGVPVLRGRGFQPRDSKDSPRVAVVNSAFAEKYLGAEPIGKRIRMDDENGPWAEIGGVVATGKYLLIADPPTIFLFLPLSQNPERRMTMLVQSAGEPANLATPMREVLRSLDTNVPILSVRTMEDIF